MIAEPRNISATTVDHPSTQTLNPPPAIVTPADFNHYLARAKAQALAALVRILNDPATPPDEVRKAATAITRTQFLSLRQPTPPSSNVQRTRGEYYEPEPLPLWGPSDVMLTSSSAVEQDQLLEEMALDTRRRAHKFQAAQAAAPPPQAPAAPASPRAAGDPDSAAAAGAKRSP